MSAIQGLPKWSRIWLIAMRDFMGYVKTWGFWLSFIFPVIGLGFGFLMGQSDIDLSPPRYEAVLDETNFHGQAILDYYEQEQAEAKADAVKALGSLLPEAEREAFRGRIDEQGVDVCRHGLDVCATSGAHAFEQAFSFQYPFDPGK